MPKLVPYTLKSNRDGLELSLCMALPDDQTPKALVQLAHGMAEHKERYYPFMEYLAAHDYGVVINDHRGHGGSVRAPGDLGYFYEGGADALVDDLHRVTLDFRARFPGAKLFLFGHSMGSLAVRVYRQRFDQDIDGLIVSGSPGKNPAAGSGLLLNKLMTLFKGDRYISKLFVNMTTGGFAKRFPDPNTANAWLSVNQDNVRRYDADPLCGFPFTLNGYRALLTLMRDAYSTAPGKHPELPVHFVSGEDDPCAPDRKGFEDAVQAMKDAGYAEVTGKMYPGLRHEILNETEQQRVYADLLAVLDGWCAR